MLRLLRECIHLADFWVLRSDAQNDMFFCHWQVEAETDFAESLFSSSLSAINHI